MIEILDKHKCCGCAACVQICPKNCISFNEDDQGFRYPSVDKEICVDCGLCEKVCPVLNRNEPKKPFKVYAAKNPNEDIRMKSSSGGIFTMLAEAIIDQGGVVFGARFDNNWEVEHAYTETKDGLEKLRGSKYVQSRIGNTYQQAKDFLTSGRMVLFTGTPCQIAGLKKFLLREYENLFTVDIVCHGVPSPLVWRTYLEDFVLCQKGIIGNSTASRTQIEIPKITSISFRDKSTGWKKYGFKVLGTTANRRRKRFISRNHCNVLLYETFDKNLFMQLFLNNLCLRSSCFRCPAKGGRSYSDITLADYWGVSNIHPNLDDDKGISVILINSLHGNKLINDINMQLYVTSYDSVIISNPCIERCVSRTSYYDQFWSLFNISGFGKVNQILKPFQVSFKNRLLYLCKSVFRRIYKFISR